MEQHFHKLFIQPFTQYRGLPKSVYVIAFQRFVNALGSFVFPFLTMFMVQKMGLTKEIAGFWVLMSSIASLCGTTIGGAVIDRMNRKKILVSVSFINAILLGFCGFLQPGMPIVYILIVICFFSGFSSPANSAMLSDITVPENRKESFSLLYLAINAGLAVSFTLAGYLFNNYYHFLFFGDAITTIISLIPFILLVPDSKPTKEDIEIIEQSDRDQEKFEKGNVFKALLKRPFLLAFVLINAVVGFVYSQHSFVMPLQLSEIFGQANGPKYFGWIMSINTTMVIFFMPLILSLTKNFKPVVNVFLATLTYIVGFGMMAFIDTLPMFFVSVVIWTIGEILHSVNTGVYISNHSPVNHRGKFSAIIELIRFTGQASAPAFMGVYLMTHSYSDAWIFTGVIALLCSIAVVILYLTENRYNIKQQKKL